MRSHQDMTNEMPAAHAPHWRLDLRQWVIALLVVLGLAATLGFAWLLDARVTELALSQGTTRAMDHVELGILRRVTAADFEPPYTPDKLDNLGTRLDPLLRRSRERHAGIVRVNLFARDGTILYSDRASLRGQAVSPLADAALGSALSGVSSTKLDDLSSLEDADLKVWYSEAIESYVPFVVDGQIVGAYDVYQDLAPYQPLRLMARGLMAVLLSIAAGLASILVLRRRWLGLADEPPLPMPPTAISPPEADAVPVQASMPIAEPPLATLASADGGVAPGATTDQRLVLRPPLGRPGLTNRQLEILQLMATNSTYREIGEQLVLDEETIRSHAKRILQKLGQLDRTQAVLAAVKAGLVELG